MCWITRRHPVYRQCYYVKARHQGLLQGSSNPNITIMKNAVIGDWEYVTSIVLLKVMVNTCDPTRIGNGAINSKEKMKRWKRWRRWPLSERIGEIDFSGLTQEQQKKKRKKKEKKIRKVLKEENSVFTVDKDAIVNVTTHKMEINISDNTSVQQSHNAIPRALYVKHYISLTVITFITHSSS